MKIILINDADGHAHAIEFTTENMRKCLQHLVDIGYNMASPEGAPELLSSGTAEEIESFMLAYNAPAGRGGQLYFVEVQRAWNFSYGPFEV